MGRLLRFLIILVVVALVLFLVRQALMRRRKPPNAPDLTHQMVRCAQCGVHLAQSEALFVGTHAYCNEAHRRSGPRPK